MSLYVSHAIPASFITINQITKYCAAASKLIKPHPVKYMQSTVLIKVIL